MSLSPTELRPFPEAEPDSAGILKKAREGVLIAAWNDPAQLDALFAEHGARIAAIIAEPLQRIIPAEPGFLAHLRALCDQHGSLLIFDEIVTGFRFAWGGAQAKYGVTPDLCTLGKTIGGGLPLAAVAGRTEIMRLFDKSQAGAQWLMQVGTLSGNPLASVAGLATLEVLSRSGTYAVMVEYGVRIQQMLREALAPTGIPFQLVGDPMLFDVVFTETPIRDYRDTFAADKTAQGTFNRVLREQGILKSPAKIYPHLALTEADLDQTESAIQAAAHALSR